MKRTALENLLTEKALAFKSSLNNEELGEYLIQHGHADQHMKNVCTKVHKSLSDRIDNVCDTLSISKRKFCELAFIEALDKAESIMEQEGIYEALGDLHAEAEAAKSEQEAA